MSDESTDKFNPMAIIDATAPEGWRKKLGKAALQLALGSRKAAQTYAAGRDVVDTAEGRSLISKALAEAVAKQVADDPDQVERAKARFMGDMLTKQENLEAVLVGASEQMKLLPAPEPEPDAQSADTHDNIEDEAQPLDPDWAADFTSRAENATSDELRLRLSRVLAGEVRQPGTYSRSTLRLIAELSKADLEAMRSAVPRILNGRIILEAWSEAEHLPIMLILTEAGLVSEATGLTLRTTFTPFSNRFRGVMVGQSHVAVLEKHDSSDILTPIAPLSRAGRAVAELLDAPDAEVELFRTVCEHYRSTLYAAQIGRITNFDVIKNSVTWDVVEHPVPTPPSATAGFVTTPIVSPS